MALHPSLPRNRTEALDWYVELQAAAAANGAGDLRAVRAWLGRNDLYFLLIDLLGRRDMLETKHRVPDGPDWLFARCREVQADPDGHLDLWAREHFKSSIITFGLTIQEILNNPEITIGIFADINKTAKPFLAQVMRRSVRRRLIEGIRCAQPNATNSARPRPPST